MWNLKAKNGIQVCFPGWPQLLHNGLGPVKKKVFNLLLGAQALRGGIPSVRTQNMYRISVPFVIVCLNLNVLLGN